MRAYLLLLLGAVACGDASGPAIGKLRVTGEAHLGSPAPGMTVCFLTFTARIAPAGATVSYTATGGVQGGTTEQRTGSFRDSVSERWNVEGPPTYAYLSWTVQRDTLSHTEGWSLGCGGSGSSTSWEEP
jgi:hypothetical protein